jgi:NAD(P)-dependent dehydrogenase (short-subunit alcohol dehydrogenase family)
VRKLRAIAAITDLPLLPLGTPMFLIALAGRELASWEGKSGSADLKTASSTPVLPGRAARSGRSKVSPKKENSMNIAKKTVLITGANRGIGLALVNEALRRGAKRVYAGTRGALTIADERVTPLKLDVTNAEQIQHAVHEVHSLDVLINNAGIALYDDMSSDDTILQQLAVNFFGPLHMTRAFLPALKSSRGAIVNNLSLVAIAPIPVVSGYSISKAAAFNMTQSLRATLAGEGVTVHSVVLGPVDTDMNRGYNIPKATTESAAAGIFDGLQNGEEYIFPDPASRSIAQGWRNGVANALEHQFAALPQAAENS